MDIQLAQKAITNLASELGTAQANLAIAKAQNEVKDVEIESLKQQIEELKKNTTDKKGGNH